MIERCKNCNTKIRHDGLQWVHTKTLSPICKVSFATPNHAGDTLSINVQTPKKVLYGEELA